MKLYNSIGPNPHAVRMVLAEKGLAVEIRPVDLRGGENRQPGYLAINPMGQLPALQLDDGTVVTEITAIGEYLDEIQPEPPLMGTTPEQRAVTRMWLRRLDINCLEPMLDGYRFGEGLSFFQNRVRCIPEASAGLKLKAREWLAWLDSDMAGRAWVAGEHFTLADITLFCFTRFAAKVGQPLDPAWSHLGGWSARVAERPSASA